MHLPSNALRWLLCSAVALIAPVVDEGVAQEAESLTIKPDRNDPKISALIDAKNLAAAESPPLGDVPRDMFFLGIAPSPTDEKEAQLSASDRQWMTKAAEETVFDKRFKTSFSTYYSELGVHLSCSWRGPAHVMKKVMAETKGTAVHTPVPEEEETLVTSNDPHDDVPRVLRFSVADIPCTLECEPEDQRCSLKNMKQLFDSGRIIALQPGVEQ